MKVNGTGIDFVVIQWTVSCLAFTPETYYVEYAKFTNGETVAMSVQYPTTNSNFSATNVEYTFFMNGLEADSTYGFVVVAVNSNGEMRTPDSFLFQTRDEGINYNYVYTLVSIYFINVHYVYISCIQVM